MSTTAHKSRLDVIIGYEPQAEPDQREFGDFEEEAIISLLLDRPDLLEMALKLLKPDMFNRIEARFVWAWLFNAWEQHGQVMTRGLLRDQIARKLTVDDPYQEVMAIIDRKSNPRDVPIIREFFPKWLKQRAMLRVFDEEVIKSVQHGQYDMLLKIIDEYHAIDTGADDPYRGLITAEDLLAQQITDEWLVRDILTPLDFCVIGGPMKSMKTAVAIDLAVSLATGAKFLGQYEVMEPRKVIIASGETSPKEMQVRISRVLRARDKETAALEGRLLWLPRTPKMNAKGHLALLRSFLQKHEPAVIIIDPLYVSMLSGDTSTQSGDIMRTGPILDNLNQICKEQNVTAVVCHHFNRKGADNGIPLLSELTQAGAAEYARQWLLLKRAQEYQHNGQHGLWMVAGGSDGRSLVKRLNIDEGNKETPRWGVSIQDVREHQAVVRKDNDRKLVGLLVAALDQLAGDGAAHVTKTMLAAALGKNNSDTTKAINLAVEERLAEEYEGQDSQGRKRQCFRRLS